MKKIDKNTYLEVEEADKFRLALGCCVQGKPIYAQWILDTVISVFSREEIEAKLATIGFEVNWSKISFAKMFKTKTKGLLKCVN